MENDKEEKEQEFRRYQYEQTTKKIAKKHQNLNEYTGEPETGD